MLSTKWTGPVESEMGKVAGQFFRRLLETALGTLNLYDPYKWVYKFIHPNIFYFICLASSFVTLPVSVASAERGLFRPHVDWIFGWTLGHNVEYRQNDWQIYKLHQQMAGFYNLA